MSAYVYKCSECDARGVKLWRQYQTMADYLKLLCLDCAEKDSGKKLGDSDQLGWLVPAVPTELPNADDCIPKGETFWGYSSVPGWGIKWWYALPPKIDRECPKDLLSREEEEAAKEAEHQKWEDETNKRINETVYVVEATSEEMNNIWLRWNTVLNFDQIGQGLFTTIGQFHNFPVCVAVSWFKIEGKLVAFYESTSRVVDNTMVEDWVDKTFPILKRGRCDYHTNATNFRHCLSSVAPDWSKDPKKKEQSDRIFNMLMGR